MGVISFRQELIEKNQRWINSPTSDLGQGQTWKLVLKVVSMSKIKEKKISVIYKKQTLCQLGTDPIRNRIALVCNKEIKKNQ